MTDLRYKIISREENGELIVVFHPEYGEQWWTIGRTTYLKRYQRCVICNHEVGKKAFRPLKNPQNRGDRICVKCGRGTRKTGETTAAEIGAE